MKRLMLTVVTLACMFMIVDAQTSKRRPVKTGPPNGIYTPAIIVGDLVFTSGQIGMNV